MASGQLGAANLEAVTERAVYTVGTEILTVMNISVCNKNASAVNVRLALTYQYNAVQGVNDYDYIEYDVQIPANGVLERTGIVMQEGYTLVAYSDTADVVVKCWGYEEDA